MENNNTRNTISEEFKNINSYIKFKEYYLIDNEDYHILYDNLVASYKSYRLTLEGEKKYKIWKRKIICDYYLEPYITHEEIIYDKETLKKLNDLRFKSFKNIKENKIRENSKYQKLIDLSLGEPIYYRPYFNQPRPKLYYKETNNYKGEIIKIYKGKWLGFLILE